MFEALKKRRAWPVADLQGVYIRLLTQGEKPRLNTFAGDKTFLAMGMILCDAEGNPSVPQEPGESDEAFAKRVQEAMVDVDDSMLQRIGDEFTRLQTRGEKVDEEAIAKN